LTSKGSGSAPGSNAILLEVGDSMVLALGNLSFSDTMHDTLEEVLAIVFVGQTVEIEEVALLELDLGKSDDGFLLSLN
jgi:hypothetical protein